MKFHVTERCTRAELIERGDILSIQDGNHGEKHPRSSDFCKDGVPFIMASDLTDGKVDLKGCNRIPNEIYRALRIGFAKPGDVLLSHKGSVGLVAIVPDEGEIMLTPQVTYHRINKNGNILNSYYYYSLASPFFQQQLMRMSGQSTRAYVGITNQKKLVVPLMSKENQSKVATILSTWDRAIELLKCQRECIRKTVQHIGRRIFLNGKLIPLKELLVSKIEYGANASAIEFNAGITPRYIRITDISDTGFLLQSGQVGIDPKLARGHHLELGDVLVARSGNTVGKSYIHRNIAIDAAFAGYLLRLKPNPKLLNPDYLFHFLQSDPFKRWVKSKIRAGAQPNINAEEYGDLLFPWVDLNEQKLNEVTLNDLESSVRIIDKLIINYEKQKLGLMQTLFPVENLL